MLPRQHTIRISVGLLGLFIALCTATGIFSLIWFIIDELVRMRTGAWEGILMYRSAYGWTELVVAIGIAAGGYLLRIILRSTSVAYITIFAVLFAPLNFVFLADSGIPIVNGFIASLLLTGISSAFGVLLAQKHKMDRRISFSLEHQQRGLCIRSLEIFVILFGLFGAGLIGFGLGSIFASGLLELLCATIAVVAFLMAFRILIRDNLI